MNYLRVRNWAKWQSYRSDRGQPPWIKLHRELMRNPEWITLSKSERGELVSMWLLAADKGGLIPADPKLIARICYFKPAPNLERFIALGFLERDTYQVPSNRPSEMAAGKVYFIRLEDHVKIGFSKNPWARIKELRCAMPTDPELLGFFDGTKDDEARLHKRFEHLKVNREWYKATPELLEVAAKGVDSGEQKTTSGLRDDYVTPRSGLRDAPEVEAYKAEEEVEEVQKKSKRKKEDITVAGAPNGHTFDFDEIKAVYPKRAGSQPWTKAAKAANARIKEGSTFSELVDGTKRYAAFMRSQGQVGTQYVMQAATFFGPERHFLEPWEKPISETENLFHQNLENARKAFAE